MISFMKTILLFLFVLFSSTMGSAQTLDNLNKQINEMLQHGDYQQALPLAEKAADLAKAKYGEQSERYAQNLLLLAE